MALKTFSMSALDGIIRYGMVIQCIVWYCGPMGGMGVSQSSLFHSMGPDHKVRPIHGNSFPGLRTNVGLEEDTVSQRPQADKLQEAQGGSGHHDKGYCLRLPLFEWLGLVKCKC